MKKIIAFVIVVSMCYSLFACNALEENSTDDISKDESTVTHESLEVSQAEVYVENIPASQLMLSEKSALVSFSSSLFEMISSGTTEIPEDFFYPETDADFPSPENEYFQIMKSNMEYYIRMVTTYDIFAYNKSKNVFDSENIVFAKAQKECSEFADTLVKYRKFFTERNYSDASIFLSGLREQYRTVEDSVIFQLLDASRTLAHDQQILSDVKAYHPEKYMFSPNRMYIDNEKNTRMARLSIENIYGYSDLAYSQGEGYAFAQYPYGALSVCRYPQSESEYDDLIMINTTLPIYNMDIPQEIGNIQVIMDDYQSIIQDGQPIYAERSRFRVRPNCAFDSAEILPIDTENEEVTFVLYDENGDEIKRITFNYMTYVFRETYPA